MVEEMDVERLHATRLPLLLAVAVVVAVARRKMSLFPLGPELRYGSCSGLQAKQLGGVEAMA